MQIIYQEHLSLHGLQKFHALLERYKRDLASEHERQRQCEKRRFVPMYEWATPFCGHYQLSLS